MNDVITQLAHGGAFILAAIGFLIFFLTQIRKAIHVEKAYGEKPVSYTHMTLTKNREE